MERRSIVFVSLLLGWLSATGVARTLHPCPYDVLARAGAPWRAVEERSLSSGFDAIRALAAHGVTTVLEGPRPSDPREILKLEFLHGTRVVFSGDVPNSAPARRIPGVVFHPSDAPGLRKAYLGEINPDLLDYAVAETLNKLTEMQIAARVDPSVVPRTLGAEEILASLPRESARRERLRERVLNGEVGAALENDLAESLSGFLAEVRRRFPELAFVKEAEEYQTGDKNSQLTTKNLDPAKVAADFLSHLDRAHAKLGDRAVRDELLNSLYEGIDTRGARLIYVYLFSPEYLLAQEGLHIRKTPLGFPMEFRVSFVQGRGVNSIVRFSSEALPEEAAEALAFFDRFYAKMPSQYRLLEGGADVILTEEGWKIIEFNFGEANGLRLADDDLVDANLYLSAVLGRPTPLIRKFEAVYATGSAERQTRFLRNLPRYYEAIGLPAEQIPLAVEQTQVWFRDRILDEEFRARPSTATARSAAERLRQVLQEVSPPGDPKSVLRLGLDYLERRLRPLADYGRKNSRMLVRSRPGSMRSAITNVG